MPDHELHLTDDAAADHLLSTNPLALLMGMLLDQQVPMEWAFSSPLKLAERLDAAGVGAEFDAAAIAALAPDQLEAMFAETPALHRYPASMAQRTQAMCQAIVDDHDGDTEAIWRGITSGSDLKKRLKALPGYGDMKAKIFMALLAKQCGVTPDGWEASAGDYALEGHRSIADVTSPETLQLVRDTKQAAKKAAKAAKADS